METNPKKKWGLIFLITGVLALLAVALILLWFFLWRFEETTEDAYVNGNQVVVTPKVAGYLTSIFVDDTYYVEEGQLLALLDPIDKQLALSEAENHLAQTVRKVGKLFANVGALQSKIEICQAELIKAEQDAAHRRALLPSGSISKEDLEHAESTLSANIAALSAAQYQLQGALALVEKTTPSTHPLIDEAKDWVLKAYINLNRCTVRSPVRGIVTLRTAQVGESVDLHTPLMTIVPLDQIWVDANFKEVQLKNIKKGQSVTLYADMYGSSVPYTGWVEGLSPATGSVQSPLPPQNATGNWIKIVQRLPVRIALDPTPLQKAPLYLGLSMHTSVDTHTSAKEIKMRSLKEPILTTDIYAHLTQGALERIDAIIQENILSE